MNHAVSKTNLIFSLIFYPATIIRYYFTDDPYIKKTFQVIDKVNIALFDSFVLKRCFAA